jgi:hypothetical protein
MECGYINTYAKPQFPDLLVFWNLLFLHFSISPLVLSSLNYLFLAMVKQVRLTLQVFGGGESELKDELQKRIRDRVISCKIPDCWLIKQGETHQICLDKRYFDSGVGRCMPIRQILFQMTFHSLPPLGRIIRMDCQPKENQARCVNPAHYKISGWKISAEDQTRLVNELGWITREQIECRRPTKKGKKMADWAWYQTDAGRKELEDKMKQEKKEAKDRAEAEAYFGRMYQ